ncbi:glycerophosphodiester phosphodiesterase [Virgibacillus sp. C22-A2]|uniref:Glycerophosphodiester phosphodiesterase n=1 Tax=Virgibacillus tibetensis TaxID=3042313 RepID=A0ABU6KAN6_9BACI|nr:glycerophosphodiester phosphodiesterase [Virgibacillus sp. C22-A2]
MRTQILAHRGASKLAPENTMPAFELAYFQEAEGIETDVQLTKDNIPVLIHDEHVKRTTDGAGYIKDLAFHQLKELDAGSWFSQKFSGTRIPSLEEFLHWAQNKRLHVNIELKNNKIDYKNIESIVYEMILHYQLLDRTTISTFNSNSLKRMRDFDNNLSVALLTSKRNKNIVAYSKTIGADAIHVKYRSLSKPLIEHSHQENMAIRVFTVNRFAHIMKCFNYGCDGIITDIPGEARLYRDLFEK